MHITFYHEHEDIFSFDCDVLPQIGNFFYHTKNTIKSSKRKKYVVAEVIFSATEVKRSEDDCSKSLWVEVMLDEVP